MEFRVRVRFSIRIKVRVGSMSESGPVILRAKVRFMVRNIRVIRLTFWSMMLPYHMQQLFIGEFKFWVRVRASWSE